MSDSRKGEYLGIANLASGVGRIAGPLLTSAADQMSHAFLFVVLFSIYASGPVALAYVWPKMRLNLDG